MILTAHVDGYVDHDGIDVKEFNSKFDSPFTPWASSGLSRVCYVIYKGLFGKYKIRQCEVMSICFTNIWSWRMDNGWQIISDELGKTVFKYDELQKAIEICERKNRMRTVKIKYL